MLQNNAAYSQVWTRHVGTPEHESQRPLIGMTGQRHVRTFGNGMPTLLKGAEPTT